MNVPVANSRILWQLRVVEAVYHAEQLRHSRDGGNALDSANWGEVLDRCRTLVADARGKWEAGGRDPAMAEEFQRVERLLG
jgi:hypothetical protein